MRRIAVVDAPRCLDAGRAHGDGECRTDAQVLVGTSTAARVESTGNTGAARWLHRRDRGQRGRRGRRGHMDLCRRAAPGVHHAGNGDRPGSAGRDDQTAIVHRPGTHEVGETCRGGGRHRRRCRRRSGHGRCRRRSSRVAGGRGRGATRGVRHHQCGDADGGQRNKSDDGTIIHPVSRGLRCPDPSGTSDPSAMERPLPGPREVPWNRNGAARPPPDSPSSTVDAWSLRPVQRGPRGARSVRRTAGRFHSGSRPGRTGSRPWTRSRGAPVSKEDP